MAKTQGKKITVGTIVGVLLLVGVFIAKQQGWLPAGDEEAAPEPGPPTTQQDDHPDATGPAPAATDRERRSAERRPEPSQPGRNTGRIGTAAIPGGDGGIGEHFRAQRSDAIVTAAGIVSRVLPDDNDGSRHQRLIVTLSTGATILIAHNIDLAERVPCDEGDLLRFRGEYEYNPQGGVVHWTHHDPAGRHQPGWIEFEGVRYQ